MLINFYYYLLDNSTDVFHLSGVFSGLKSIVKTEGVVGLFKGNGAQMIRVFPYAAIQFASFEFYKKVSLLIFFNNIMHFLIFQ